MNQDQKSNRMITGLEEADYDKALEQATKTSNRFYKGE